MAQVEVKFLREDWADPDLPLPRYETDGAAGFDLRAQFTADAREAGLTLAPQTRALIQTGFRVAVPRGYELQIRPRSGLALKHGVTLANAPGTVDCDYRGPLGVILINLGDAPFVIGHGDRIAQGVVAPVPQVRFTLVSGLDETARGAGGFGSTGQG
jgi:dUTP pyrophosphatase